MTKIFAQLLKARGFGEDFLEPRYEALFAPAQLVDMARAVERIERARETGEHIVIFGDYDVDGVTASAVMYEGLTAFGCERVTNILPDRFKDGFGMGGSVIPKVVELGATLVITVDNGSSSGAVIAALKERGVDTIVTDHHEITEFPAAAYAVVNPKRAENNEGKRLAGVGVAFLLAKALNERKNGGVADGQEKWLLDLVAIGTICDAMELTHENRILVWYGIKVLRKTRRLGLKELAEAAGIAIEAIDAHGIGYQLGPRINAAGRLKSAELALALLKTRSRAEALRLATELNALNEERRRIQDEATRSIGRLALEEQPVVVARGEWHEGVIGVIAGRVMEQYRQPTMILTEVGGGVLKGSGRSFGDFSLAAFIAENSDLLVKGGGHAQACGVTIMAEAFDDLRERINQFYRNSVTGDQAEYWLRSADVVVADFSELDEQLFTEIQCLEPFGNGNEEPVFELEGEIVERKVLKEKHLSLRVCDVRGEERKLMGFFARPEWLALNEGERVRAGFTLMRNEWRGRVEIEGRLEKLEKI